MGNNDRNCGLVAEFLATDPEVWVRFPALLDFLRSCGSGTVSTQPREYNWGATWKKKYRLRSRNPRIGSVGIRHADYTTLLYPRKFALTSPTSGRSLGRYSSFADGVYYFIIYGWLLTGIIFSCLGDVTVRNRQSSDSWKWKHVSLCKVFLCNLR
jgi:hypothetical protein